MNIAGSRSLDDAQCLDRNCSALSHHPHPPSDWRSGLASSDRPLLLPGLPAGGRITVQHSSAGGTKSRHRRRRAHETEACASRCPRLPPFRTRSRRVGHQGGTLRGLQSRSSPCRVGTFPKRCRMEARPTINRPTAVMAMIPMTVGGRERESVRERIY